MQSWPQGQRDLARALTALKDRAAGLTGVAWEVISRPGVSHSLRFRLEPPPEGRARPVFFLVDVVPLGLEQWMLSVCFYEDEVSDPDELGNAIPQGLFDETGYCFDMEEDDPALLEYCLERLAEAHRAASGR